MYRCIKIQWQPEIRNHTSGRVIPEMEEHLENFWLKEQPPGTIIEGERIIVEVVVKGPLKFEE